MIIYRKTILNSSIQTLAAIFIGCTSLNYYSSKQQNRIMKEMIECIVTYIRTREEKDQLIPLNTYEGLNAFLVEFWKSGTHLLRLK